MAALSEPALVRKQKPIAKKTTRALPSAGAAAQRKAPLPENSPCVEIFEPVVTSAASASTSRFGSGFDIDPATLSHYISIVGRKNAGRIQKALNFDMTKCLSRFVQPGSEIQVTSGITAVLRNATS